MSGAMPPPAEPDVAGDAELAEAEALIDQVGLRIYEGDTPEGELSRDVRTLLESAREGGIAQAIAQGSALLVSQMVETGAEQGVEYSADAVLAATIWTTDELAQVAEMEGIRISDDQTAQAMNAAMEQLYQQMPERFDQSEWAARWQQMQGDEGQLRQDFEDVQPGGIDQYMQLFARDQGAAQGERRAGLLSRAQAQQGALGP